MLKRCIVSALCLCTAASAAAWPGFGSTTQLFDGDDLTSYTFSEISSLYVYQDILWGTNDAGTLMGFEYDNGWQSAFTKRTLKCPSGYTTGDLDTEDMVITPRYDNEGLYIAIEKGCSKSGVIANENPAVLAFDSTDTGDVNGHVFATKIWKLNSFCANSSSPYNLGLEALAFIPSDVLEANSAVASGAFDAGGDYENSVEDGAFVLGCEGDGKIDLVVLYADGTSEAIFENVSPPTGSRITFLEFNKDSGVLWGGTRSTSCSAPCSTLTSGTAYAWTYAWSSGVLVADTVYDLPAAADGNIEGFAFVEDPENNFSGLPKVFFGRDANGANGASEEFIAGADSWAFCAMDVNRDGMVSAADWEDMVCCDGETGPTWSPSACAYADLDGDGTVEMDGTGTDDFDLYISSRCFGTGTLPDECGGWFGDLADLGSYCFANLSMETPSFPTCGSYYYEDGLCYDDDQCDPQVCGDGVCVDCMVDGDCSGQTPKCRTATNTCVQCLTSADCPGTETCNYNYQCVGGGAQ